MAFNTELGQPAPLVVVEAERSGSAVTIEVTGDIDTASSPGLHEKVRTLLESGPSAVVLDLTGVGFCDSSGLSVLVQLNRFCEESSIELRIAPSRVVRRAIELTGLSSVLRIAQ